MRPTSSQAKYRPEILPSRPAAALALLSLALPCSALEVHEWGTFTTLNSSSGKALSGLFVDVSRLPDFVHGLPYFNYDPAAGWPSAEKLRNVTVKMETPVIYFYADRQTEVDVKVSFRGGTISQWYPQCYLGEADPASPFVDFAREPYRGRIAWKATVLAPGTAVPYTTAATGKETQEWTAPRYTDANLLRGEGGEYEKFLFYRGLGNFSSALSLDFLEDGKLRLANHGAEDIPYLMVYHRPQRDNKEAYGNEEAPGIWFEGPLPAGSELRLARDQEKPDYAAGGAAMQTFQDEMVKAGLTVSEARALLNTWYNGYFIESGLKAFWILPRAQVDRILPLEITPNPDKLVRVMVGRSEILTPEFEQELLQARNDDSLEARFGKDKYYLAYREYLAGEAASHNASGLGGNGSRSRRSPATGSGDRAAPAWGSRNGSAGWAAPWFPKADGSAADAQGRRLRPR